MLSTGGDSQLGGDDFDLAVAELLMRMGLESPESVSAGCLQRVRLQAEATKIELTEHFETAFSRG